MFQKVVTLNNEQFAQACRQLEAIISKEGFKPDAVLSIRCGGEFVGKELFRDIPHFATELQRPSTKHKSSMIKNMVAHLPLCINNLLRIIESKLLAMRRPQPVAYGMVNLQQMATVGNILVVDDAVDSGATLKAVVDAVSIAMPAANIATAVITVTTKHPLISPSYSLYTDLSLIRFPWSMDAKK